MLANNDSIPSLSFWGEHDFIVKYRCTVLKSLFGYYKKAVYYVKPENGAHFFD